MMPPRRVFPRVLHVHANIVAALASYTNTSGAVTGTLPSAWAGNAFDRTWILDLSKGKIVSFRNLPQHLMPGDSDK